MSHEAHRHGVHRAPTARAVPEGRASSYCVHWLYRSKGHDPVAEVRRMPDRALALLVEDIEEAAREGHAVRGTDGRSLHPTVRAAALAEWESRKGE